MNDLYSFYAQHRNTRVMHKWDHYFEIYDRFLSPIRRSNPVVLEIGVQLGGSMEMWRDYFGPTTRLYGIDINPEARQQEDIATRIFIGDQQDRGFLRSVLQEVGQPTVVIDDGGHRANQQITSFEELYPALTDNGIYIVEDTHSSLWPGVFMDRQDQQSFLQFSLARCADLMEWTGKRENFQILGSDQADSLTDTVSEFCRNTKAISFFDSMIVYERARRRVPRHTRR
ncbi:MAG: class I SAM-dependent methyltransferase [Acetobacteraceae bacterium]